VRDLDYRNGTFVNGQRVWRERPLRPGDELRVGATRLVYRSDEPAGGTGTQASEPPPELTRREREVHHAPRLPTHGRGGGGTRSLGRSGHLTLPPPRWPRHLDGDCTAVRSAENAGRLLDG
jgi:hypothetical protein